MGKAFRILIVTLLSLWVVTAVAYRLWQRHNARVAAVTLANAPKPEPASPARPHGEVPDPHTLAEAACGRTVFTRGSAIACPVCPEGSDDGEEPQPQPDGGWTFDSALPGHFTAPDAHEALMRISGCESHASGFGGDFLLRNTDGHWSVVRYIHAADVREGCQTVPWPADATGSGDAVICEGGDMGQGVVEDSLTLTRYGNTAPADAPTGEHSVFLSVTDESATCDPEGVDHDDPVQVATIKRWNLLPAPAGGRGDLVIHVEVEQRHRIKTGDGCKPGPVKRVTLRYRNMGDQFEAVEGLAAMRALQGRSDPPLPSEVRPDIY